MQSMAARASAMQALAGRSKIQDDAAIVLQKYARRLLVQRMIERTKARAKLEQAMREASAALHGIPDQTQAEHSSEHLPTQPPARAQTAPAAPPRARAAPNHSRRLPLVRQELDRRRARRTALRSAHEVQRQRMAHTRPSSILTQLQDDALHRRRPVHLPTAAAAPSHSYPPTRDHTPGHSTPAACGNSSTTDHSYSHMHGSSRPPPAMGMQSTCGDPQEPLPSVIALRAMYPSLRPPAAARPEHTSLTPGNVRQHATHSRRDWPLELQEMVQFGEAVYGQFQRGITPSTADRSTPPAQPSLTRAGLSVDAEAPGHMEALLELWETGRVARAPDSPAGIAHVLTATQQAQCLVGLGTCFEQLVGGYEMLWRRPDTVNVDERDWLARRAMQDSAEVGGEELKPLWGRVVRTTADLGPLITELDKARTPSIGQWRDPVPLAAAGGSTKMLPLTPELTESRDRGCSGAPGLQKSNSAVWPMEDVSMRGSSPGLDAFGGVRAATSAGNGPPCTPDGDSDRAPWSGAPGRRAGGGGGAEEEQLWHAEHPAGDSSSRADQASSFHRLLGDEDDCGAAAAEPAPYTYPESSVSTMMRTITGDARLAGALPHLPVRL